MAALIFGCAGTVHYWQGWIYLSLFVGMSAAITLDLIRHDPALLARRMKGGPTAERRPLQRLIMLGASLGFVGLLVIPALDFRFKWSEVPPAGVLGRDILFALGFGVIARVYRENTFTAATIQVVEGQHVITTGPYAIVRHPMYASALVYLIGTPLALGSYRGLIALVFMLPSCLAADRRRAPARARVARLYGLPAAASEVPTAAVHLVAPVARLRAADGTGGARPAAPHHLAIAQGR